MEVLNVSYSFDEKFQYLCLEGHISRQLVDEYLAKIPAHTFCCEGEVDGRQLKAQASFILGSIKDEDCRVQESKKKLIDRLKRDLPRFGFFLFNL
jgi:hypothetical protein